jgi:eukaryotic-like serine/threonine-protein kinase
MTLDSGTILGPYQILAPLGAGGMGEVYRARDTRLQRDVAIKVLPESFARDAERLRRFEQEARAVAALNHPNILAVHDIGAQDGTHYIVTELLDGRTLREQLDELHGSALPARKTIDYTRQICDGLAAAHNRGIVHRDLKPDNIFCTREGRIKILDFGLAKQTPAASEAATLTGDTPISAQTQPGMVMGTVGYMSPEQVRGTPTDHRSDIFSLGAILYEMLSGRRAFRRDTTAETMTAILREEPPELTGTNAALPPALQRIVHRCLEKEPAQRFQSAADLGFALEALSGSAGIATGSAANSTLPSTAASAAAEARPPGARSARKWHPLITAALVMAALAAGWFARNATIAPKSVTSFTQVTFRRGTVYAARLASDGNTVVYTAAWDGGLPETYVASKEAPESQSLNVKNAILLSVSPSGELAILTAAHSLHHYEFEGTLSTMPMGGGAPRDILKNVTAADWSVDGQSMAVIHLVDGKVRLEFPIGKVLYETSGEITQPHISPDGKMVAFLNHPYLGDDRGSVMVVDLTGKSKVLSDGWESEQGLDWSNSGNEVWFSATQRGSDFAIQAVTLAGKLRQVLAGPGGMRLFDIAPDGRLLMSNSRITYSVYASINGAPTRDLSYLDTSYTPTLSNDGKLILFSSGSQASGNLYAVLLRGTDGSPVIHMGQGQSVAISPDNAWAAALLQKERPEIVMLPIGPGEALHPPSANLENAYSAFGWMPDSHRFLFAGSKSGDGQRIYIQDARGGAARAITPEGFTSILRIPVSPDGRRFLALNQHTSQWNVCQIPEGQSSGPSGSQPENSTCARLPGTFEERDRALQWSADGKYIYTAADLPGPGYCRTDLATGQRSDCKHVVVPDLVGAATVAPSSVTPDGKSVSSTVTRLLDQIYIADGVN